VNAPENPPAYPFVLPTKYRIAEAGMTLRDWFAGQAMMGLLATYDTTEVAWESIAHRSYGIASAMLRERGEDGAS
jgi:hypothetical protein